MSVPAVNSVTARDEALVSRRYRRWVSLGPWLGHIERGGFPLKRDIKAPGSELEPCHS